jgi:hypothetical protein
MRINELVTQRFSELTEKAVDVAKTRQEDSFETLVSSEKFHEWATSVLDLLQRAFGENSAHYLNFERNYKAFNGAFDRFETCKGIFQSAKGDYEKGYLFSFRALVKAEDSTDALEQAAELLRAGYKDLACIVAGVALEITLKELCTRNSIPHAKLDAMNIELCKKGIYNMGMQKLITAWAHWRNKAAHGEWNEYNNNDVDDMIRGVNRFVAEYL